jgi:hypothetical protein
MAPVKLRQRENCIASEAAPAKYSFEYDKHWLARSKSNTMAAAERSKPI